MRSNPIRAIATAALVLTTLAGCSSRSDEAAPSSSSTSATSTTTAESTPSASGPARISPGGVTTNVDAPAESTEDEYFQACHTAKLWMDQHGEQQNKFEAWLATVQKSDSTDPGTFGMPWSKLTPPRQAAVIVAAQAAADQLCG